MRHDPQIPPPPSPRLRPGAFGLGLVVIALLATAGLFGVSRMLGNAVLSLQQARSFRVMTWNLGKLYLRWESRAADRDLEHVAEVIRQINPHVAALQELRDRRQLGHLLATLGPGWRGTLSEDAYDRRAGLITRLPASFSAVATSTGRTAQAARVLPGDGRAVVVVSVHLDAFDPRRRRIQAEEILTAARRIPAEALVLAGDFNVDTAVAARHSEDQQLYRLLTREFTDAAKHAGPTTLTSHRLDYVFFNGKGIRSVHSQVVPEQRINLMDHDPLVVDFYL